MSDEVIAEQLGSIKDNIVAFVRHQLTQFLPREDYKEVLHLVLLYLGENLEGVQICAPGAHHRAKWMCKIIYSLKIYLFRSQFNLTASELKGLRIINNFIVEIYLKH